MYEMNPLIYVRAKYVDGNFSGLIQECCEKEPHTFSSTEGMETRIDYYASNMISVRNIIDYYCPRGDWEIDSYNFKYYNQDYVTYWIEIIACQHGTWQGKLTCRGKKNFFKSKYDLFSLMEDAYASDRSTRDQRKPRAAVGKK